MKKKVNIQSLYDKLTMIYGDECEKNVVGMVIFENNGEYFFDEEFKHIMNNEEVEALLLRGAVIEKDGAFHSPASFNNEGVSFSTGGTGGNSTNIDLSDYAKKSDIPISVLKGKSLLCIGDSISTNQNASKIYSQVFAEMGIFSSVKTEGVAGREVSAKSSKGTTYKPLANVYMNMPEADIITIFMGVNDYSHHTPLGTIADTTDVSFYGALHVVLTGLISMYPSSRIIWISPMHRDFGTLGRDDTPNNDNHILKDYVNAIREVCEMYAVPVIDLFKMNGMSPLIPIIKSTYTTDGLHLNNLGHQKIAGIIKQWLEIYCADLTVEVPTIETCTITYKYMCNGASIKANTTEVVTKGTSKTFSTSNAPSISGYTISSVSPTSATINSNTTVTYTYIVNEVVEPEPEDPSVGTGIFDGYTMALGNNYAHTGATNRLSLNPKGVYITAGTTISPKSGYKWGGYIMTSTTTMKVGNPNQYWSGYSTEPFTMSSDGYAGFVVGRIDDTDFDLTVDSTNPLDYLIVGQACNHNYIEEITQQATCTEQGVKTYTCSKCNYSYVETIAKLEHNFIDNVCTNCGKEKTDTFIPEEGKEYVTLQYGNLYGTSSTINDKLSLNPKFISVPNGFTVTAKEGYEIGVYWSGKLQSGGWVTTYTVPQAVSGNFGIAIRKVDKTDFDLTVDSIYPQDYVDVSDPSVFEI